MGDSVGDSIDIDRDRDDNDCDDSVENDTEASVTPTAAIVVAAVVAADVVVVGVLVGLDDLDGVWRSSPSDRGGVKIPSFCMCRCSSRC